MKLNLILSPQLLPALRNVSGSYFRQDGKINAVLLQIVCIGHELAKSHEHLLANFRFHLC